MRPTDSADGPEGTPDTTRHICPWWLGYLLANPLRRLVESPERLLAPHVRPGMTVVEPGCGMGYFSLPLARMVGPNGKVVCVDLQPRMIRALERRARRAGLADRIHTIVCTANDLGLAAWRESADLAVALHMVHEVPGETRLFEQLRDVLKPGGALLVTEPPGHVSRDEFKRTLALARQAGFVGTDRPVPGRGHRTVLVKPRPSG